jgi:hypothetical protein
MRFAIAILVTLSALTLRGDTVELKTGERVDGVFRQAGAAGVVIEIAGQAVTIPLAKVQGIYLGAAKPAVASTVPPLSGEVLDALRALRSVTESGVNFHDYAPRVLDAKIKTDKYLSSSANDAEDLRSAIGLATREYELASRAWDGSFPGHEDLSWWKTLEANLDPDLVKKCPVVRKVVDRVEMAAAYQGLGMRDTAIVEGQTAWAALWKCAAGQVAEAERLLAQPAPAPNVAAPKVGTAASPKAASTDPVPGPPRAHIANQ